MQMEHDAQLDEAKNEVARLQENESHEQAEIMNERERAEEQAWDDYNGINDKNRELLSSKIKDGLGFKATLTTAMTELSTESMQRDRQSKELEEKKSQLDTTMQEQQKIKGEITACEEQYRARLATIEEKDIQIGQL